MYRESFKGVKKNFLDSTRKKVQHVFDGANSVKHIKLYLVSQLGEITEGVKRRGVDYQKLHELRMLIKEYLYNIALVNDCILENRILSRHITRLKHIAEVLGKLHDSVVMFHLVQKKKSKKDFSPSEIKPVNRLSRKLATAISRLTKNMKKEFPSLLVNLEFIKKSLSA